MNIAFICVHNSCRSQIAEALAKKYLDSSYQIYSAGTKVKDQINPDAVRLMRLVFQIDMKKEQRPKLLDELPEIDLAITMGCNVACPSLKSKYKEDWGLSDPTGLGDEAMLETMSKIKDLVLDLKTRGKEFELSN